MGSTGDPPVPSGHWPDGMGRLPTLPNRVRKNSCAALLPSGGSPLGTGQWPVLPAAGLLRHRRHQFLEAHQVQHAFEIIHQGRQADAPCWRNGPCQTPARADPANPRRHPENAPGFPPRYNPPAARETTASANGPVQSDDSCLAKTPRQLKSFTSDSLFTQPRARPCENYFSGVNLKLAKQILRGFF